MTNNIINFSSNTVVVGDFVITEPKYDDTYDYRGYFASLKEMKKFMCENANDGNIITLVKYKIIIGDIDDFF